MFINLTLEGPCIIFCNIYIYIYIYIERERERERECLFLRAMKYMYGLILIRDRTTDRQKTEHRGEFYIAVFVA